MATRCRRRLPAGSGRSDRIPQRLSRGAGAGNGPPFNSQSTTWWRDAFGLLYLPTTRSFRMTDIYRSLVAQRIARANCWHVLFHLPNVRQVRNKHDFMQDIAAEIDGYLHNKRLIRAFADLDIQTENPFIPNALRLCYATMTEMGLVERR